MVIYEKKKKKLNTSTERKMAAYLNITNHILTQ